MHLGSPLGTVENGVTNIHHKGAMMKLVPVQRSSETMRSLDPFMYIRSLLGTMSCTVRYLVNGGSLGRRGGGGGASRTR